MMQVKMNAGNIGGLLQLPYSGNTPVPADGIVTVDSRDAPDLLRMGANYVSVATRSQYIAAPILGAVGQIVASTAFSNGTKTIANQPDRTRLSSVRVDPGTLAITAGNVAVNYVATDGTTQIDNISAITAASTIVSTNLSKAANFFNSVVVTAVAGGASPQLQVDTLNSLGLAVDPGYVDFAIADLKVDGADSGVSSVQSSAAAFTPSTAPNGTHNYNVLATYRAGVQ